MGRMGDGEVDVLVMKGFEWREREDGSNCG